MLKFSRYVSNNSLLYRIRKHQASKRRHHLRQNLHRRSLLHQKVGQTYHLSQRMKSGVFFLQWLQSPHKIWYPDSSLGFEVQRWASLTPFFSLVMVLFTTSQNEIPTRIISEQLHLFNHWTYCIP